jgi:hypothetical protein
MQPQVISCRAIKKRGILSTIVLLFDNFVEEEDGPAPSSKKHNTHIIFNKRILLIILNPEPI